MGASAAAMMRPTALLGRPALMATLFLQLLPLHGHGGASAPRGHCEGYPYLEFRRLLHNNLGRRGPDAGDEGMVFRTVSTATGEEVDLHIHATTAYKPYSPLGNGFSGEYGNLNMRANTSVDLKLSFHQPRTNAPVVLQTFPLSIFDLDEDPNGQSREYVIAEGFDKIFLSRRTEIKQLPQPDGRTLFHSSAIGYYGDNPTSSTRGHPAEERRAVTLIFSNVSAIPLTVGVGQGTTPRMLFFESRLRVDCPSAAASRLPPLARQSTETPVQAPPGSVFEAWRRSKGDVVKAGDALATVKDSNGVQSVIRAPKEGAVVSLQPLRPGDAIDDVMADTAIMVLGALPRLPPLLVKKGQVPIVAGDGLRLEAWRVAAGDVVRRGDGVASVSDTGGNVSLVRAPKGGTLLSRLALEPGESIGSRATNQVLAVIEPFRELPPLPPRKSQMPVTCDSAAAFRGWRAEEGDLVMKGDPVAVVGSHGGREEVVRAPVTGTLVVRQPLRTGAVMGGQEPRATIALIEPLRLPPAKVSKFQEPVMASAARIFVEWLATIGDVLQRGDPVAAVRRKMAPGQQRHAGAGVELIRSPHDGTVVFMQPLQPDDPIDSKLSDKILAVLDVRLPPLFVDHSSGQVRLESAAGSVFVEWRVNASDRVEEGDPVCIVTMTDPSGAGGTDVVIMAPKPGTVLLMQPLRRGDVIDDTLMDRTVAVIGSSDGLPMPWRELQLVIFLFLCFQMLCTSLLCIGGRRGLEATTGYGALPAQDGQCPMAPLPTPRKHVQARDLESLWKLDVAMPPEPDFLHAPGVRFDFADGACTVHTYYFDHRPLGIIYDRDRGPAVRVKGFKFNSYAKHKGIRQGWVITRVGNTDVSVSSGLPLHQTLQIIHDSLRPFKVWPLRLDFKDRGKSKSKSFMVEKYPIGIVFSAMTPIVISKIQAKSYAESIGLKLHSEITRIHDEVVCGDYDSIMHKFRDAVDLLDVSGGPNPVYT